MGGPLIINHIYTLYHLGIYWVCVLLKGSNKGVKQLGALHPKGTSIFPMTNVGLYLKIFKTNMSHEKNPGWLGYIRDYTTQLYRDYNKPLLGSLLTNQYNGK